MKAGEIVIFDRAYVDFIHLYELTQRGVSWDMRTKKNMKFRTNNFDWAPGSVLERYGTAGARLRCIAQPETLWLPGLRPRAVG